MDSEHVDEGAVSAGEVLGGYLRAQAGSILVREDDVLADAPDAVHQMRVSARRLRSVIASYRRLLRRSHTDPLAVELAWLGSVLSPARDAEVLRARFAKSARSAAPELAAPLDDHLSQQHEEALARMRVALSGTAYVAVRTRLDQLVAKPPLRDRARRDASSALPPLVHRACARVRRVAELADDDLLLHEVRKAAKRARYAADAAVPGCGAPYAELASAMSALQSVLGEHQDSLVAQELLRAHPALGEHPGMEALIAHEQSRAEETLRGYPPALVAALAAVPTVAE